MRAAGPRPGRGRARPRPGAARPASEVGRVEQVPAAGWSQIDQTAVPISETIGASEGVVVGPDRADRGGDDAAGAGHPDRVRRDRVLPGAQDQEPPVVAGTLQPQAGEQLHPVVAAAGVPADGAVEGAPGGPVGRRQLDRLRRRHRRGTGRVEGPDQGPEAVGVGEAVLLADRVDAVALGVVEGAGLAERAGAGELGGLLGRQHVPEAERLLGLRGLADRRALGAGAVQVGGRPPGTCTTAPPRKSATTAAATPVAVCARRRAAPERRMIEGRGKRESLTRSVSAVRCPRTEVEGTSRWVAKREVAVCSSRSAAASGETDLTGHLLHADRAELGEQQHLALGQAELGERVEGGARVGVEALVAVPDPGGVPALRVLPRVRPDPALGVRQAGDLAPVVPRGDEGVPDRAAGGGEVAGERVGLYEEAPTGGLVERVELF